MAFKSVERRGSRPTAGLAAGSDLPGDLSAEHRHSFDVNLPGREPLRPQHYFERDQLDHPLRVVH
jgi:hypothetical protein